MRFNKEPIRDFFVFSRKERSGIIGLLIVVAIALVLHYAFDQYTFPLDEEVVIALKNYKEEQKRIEAKLEQDSSSIQSIEVSTENEIPENFQFDPNLATHSIFKITGLKPYLITRIINFRNKGGKFNEKADLLKIYSMDTIWYTATEKYISIISDTKNTKTISSTNWSTENKSNQNSNRPIPKSIEKFNLNEADTNQLKALVGIASYSANKIIKNRDRFGGFVTIDQVDSIWGISDVAKQELKKNCYVTLESIHQISVNTATLDELKNHPYISYTVAKVIVAYREKHGPYIKLVHIKRTDLVDDQLYSKIAPYLKL